MKWHRVFLQIAILMSLLCRPGYAVSPAQPSVRGDQPIQIKADELSTDNAQKTATFSGNVTARQGDITIYSDRLIVHYGAKEREVTKVEALGKVRIVQGNRIGQSGRALYDNRSGTILLEDNPRVNQGEDMVTGKTITFYVNEQKSVVTGGSEGRVQAVIHPKGAGSNVGTGP